jgi:ADP-ribose pyrophosphatase
MSDDQEDPKSVPRGQAERLSSWSPYRGHRLTIDVDRVRLPNDQVTELVIVRHPGAAAIVPELDGDILMLRQYRYATGGWLLEIPAGTLDGNEAPEVAAARELEEETGYAASRFTPLGWVWSSPGFCGERIWLYLAQGLNPAHQRLEADEVIAIERVPWQEAIALAERGALHDAKSVAALLRAAPFLRGVRAGAS